MSFQPRYGIVCDNVRREDNGKAIIIGVYAGRMSVAQFPCPVFLSFWLEGDAVKENTDFELKVEILNDQNVVQSTHPTKVVIAPTPVDETTAIVIPGMYVLNGPGALVLSYKAQDEWEELLRKTIQQLTTASIEQPRPS